MKEDRRKFLKYLIVGSGIFLIGKLLDFNLKDLFSNSKKNQKEVYFKNFKIVENKEELSFYERGTFKDEKVLVIDKENINN